MSGSASTNLPDKQPHPEQPYFPPPPPGPPPANTGSHPAQHPNEVPIPDYNIPGYDPSKPAAAGHDSDFVGPSPTPTGLYDDPAAHPNQHHHQHGGKHGWSQRFSDWGTKAAAPLNALATKMGSETFLPTTMDKECEKAARILKGFCKDGIYSETIPAPTTTGDAASDKPKAKSRVLLTIPSKVISRAQGLLIFTTVRAGFHVTGATGSGVLVARLPDGTWSPPSGVQVHSLGAGFVAGLDIYDCVVVINTRAALDAFTRTRVSLGSDLAVTAGPWGAGGMVDWGLPPPQEGGKANNKAKRDEGEDREKPPTPPTTAAAAVPASTTIPQTEPHAPPIVIPPPPASTTDHPDHPPTKSSADRRPSPLREALSKPVYSYVKSRGFYAGVQVDGTVVTERADANAAFYGARVPVLRILAGDVPRTSPPPPSAAQSAQTPSSRWPAGAATLAEVLKGAEGRNAQSQSHAQTHHHQPPTTHAGAGSSTAFASSSSAAAGAAADGTNPSGSGPAYSKAAEAAAEARANDRAQSPGPPAYAPVDSEAAEDLPPAYVDDGVPRPGVGDSKVGPR